ncbi:zeta toxin family protein [candidate division TA06 bacterium]|uniref:Zeta toxin family protein n=1 Tax=candidate division TA06 bacterium TaxID=2250710 RepID=A0A933I9G9_UNCT6|nr:zeta toxin family protein [candidate division TA06 bacterium]
MRLKRREYVNADAIAAGISPFKPEQTAIQAGRLMLERIHYLANRGEDFAFETTMASKTFVPLLRKCKNKGYSITLIYLWLASPELAIKRVALRMAGGGHNIPADVIQRRYFKGLRNFYKLYLPFGDSWKLYDNSQDQPYLVAYKNENSAMEILQEKTWDIIKGSAQ